jgi:threonine aldolase
MYTVAHTTEKMLADFRSDTVTTPCKAMLEYMTNSPVGDDVFSEDPTTLHLESLVAQMTGKAAALFVATGTMSNQLALKSQLTGPCSVVMSRKCHINMYEANALAMHTGAVSIPIDTDFLTLADVQKYAIVDDDVHHAPTQLVVLENTMNGKVYATKQGAIN